MARLRLEKDPEDIEWLRLQGFALWLRARLAMDAEEWPRAIMDLNAVISIRLALLDAEPDNTSLRLELGSVYGTLGDCLRKQKHYDEAHARYAAAYDIYADLDAQGKSAGTVSIELSRLESRLGVLCMSYKLPKKNEEAATWFDQATRRLQSLPSTVATDRAGDISALLTTIKQNQEILLKRKTRGLEH
jgi:tetratricopeptide (TPR) repeat protein